MCIRDRKTRFGKRHSRVFQDMEAEAYIHRVFPKEDNEAKYYIHRVFPEDAEIHSPLEKRTVTLIHHNKNGYKDDGRGNDKA